MKFIKTLILQILLLLVMCLFGTIVIKIFDMVLNLSIESIGETGFKVGFLAWIILLVMTLYNKKYNSKKEGKK